MLTNTELAILGLVAEGPRHGYQIEQDIEARGMRQWTEIGFSSIYYILNKLESAGWLASELQPEPPDRQTPARRGPARKVYRLAEAGWGVLREAVRERLASPRPFTGDFLLGLANLASLPPDEARAALEVHRSALRQQLDAVRAKQIADRGVRAAHSQSGQDDKPGPAESAEVGSGPPAGHPPQSAGHPPQSAGLPPQSAGLPPHVEALFDYSLSQMMAELAWLDRYLQSTHPSSGDRS